MANDNTRSSNDLGFAPGPDKGAETAETGETGAASVEFEMLSPLLDGTHFLRIRSSAYILGSLTLDSEPDREVTICIYYVPVS